MPASLPPKPLLIVTFAGQIPADLASTTGSTSRLDVPLGRRAQSELVLSLAEEIAPSSWETIGVFDDATSYIREHVRERWSLLQMPTSSRGLGETINWVLSKESCDRTIAVMYGDSLFNAKDFSAVTWTNDSIGLGHPSTYENWQWVNKDGHFCESPTEQYWQESSIHELGMLGVVAGFFLFSDGPRLRKQLQHAQTTSEFLNGVGQYFHDSSSPPETLDIPSWNDLGHYSEYRHARRQAVAGRHFNRLTVQGEEITKVLSDSSKEESEYSWFASAPRSIRNFLPEVRKDLSRDGYQLSYIAGLTLGQRCLSGALHEDRIAQITNGLDSWFHNSSSESPDATPLLAFQDFVAVKFRKRLETLISHPEFKDIQSVQVNCSSYSFTLNRDHLWTTLQTQKFSFVQDERLGYTHGDLYFGNILLPDAEGQMKLVDPRGTWDSHSQNAYQIYDWAKLAQSIFLRFDELERNWLSVNWQNSQRPVLTLDTAPHYAGNLRQFATWFTSTCPSPLDAIKLAGALSISSSPLHIDEGVGALAMATLGLQMLVDPRPMVWIQS